LTRVSGCNKIDCPNCFKIFCWICLRLISGYRHFQDNDGCKTFEDPNDNIDVQFENNALSVQIENNKELAELNL